MSEWLAFAKSLLNALNVSEYICMYRGNKTCLLGQKLHAQGSSSKNVSSQTDEGTGTTAGSDDTVAGSG